MNERDKDNNIIPFPGSAGKLVTLGLRSLKAGDCEEALQYFLEALAHDPHHEEASYGLLLAFADSGRLQEGREWAEKLLRTGEANYFEVLQVYVSILAQLEEYEQVVSVLEAILEEEKFPPHMADKLYELLELSHSMIRSDMEPYVRVDSDKASIDTCVDWKDKLMRGTPDQKMAALRELRLQEPDTVLPAIESVLADNHASPLLKSILLLLLKDWRIEKDVWVHKLDRQGEFSPVSLSLIEESASYIKSSQLLEDKLGQVDPVLLKNSYHLMRQLYLFYYPFPPSIELEALAAVIHHDAALQTGNDITMSELVATYKAEEMYIQNMMKEYQRIKKYMFDL
ncbi:tetratricopeptide repeat protein [Alteribacillus iranensis]|uniref:Tetratricopeptide repeat-containing protein n=1 Tax=Alteribacillus iranensis TaxID=930128 RepID=A0A1I2CN46_9BACI|nr:tetratricopeptide repeat protein [Alteribacillus iranensis]SFE69654.1 Tetratricopeptide repeat-containing protein [Alteribacillus iranensis]